METPEPNKEVRDYKSLHPAEKMLGKTFDEWTEEDWWSIELQEKGENKVENNIDRAADKIVKYTEAYMMDIVREVMKDHNISDDKYDNVISAVENLYKSRD